MRLLVRCAACDRHFDATGQEAGERFRCFCGETVRVAQPRGHDARLVRCSACGASRDTEGRSCAFCGADFTLHERDLHTVCPACMARVSDAARFCHGCGVRLEADHGIGVLSGADCPACGAGTRLRHRQIGDASLLECSVCAGLWAARSAFDALLRAAAQEATPAAGPVTRPPGGLAEQKGPMYRRCVECGHHMARQNFARVTGVIIDSCKKHGVWFDAHELDRILAWVRAGGLLQAVREEPKRIAPAMPLGVTPVASPGGEAAFDLLHIVGWAIGKILS